MGPTLRKSTLGDDHNLDIFSLVWLDVSVNSTAENLNVQKQLRTLINNLKTFDNTHDCIHYIRNVSKQNRLILIVSGRLGREIVPRIHRLKQVACIYVYCFDKEKNEKWAHKYSKIKGVIVNLDELVGQLRSDRGKRNFDEIDESFSFNLYKKSLSDEQTSTNSNKQFIHFELLIDCLLRMKSDINDKSQLISQCREIYQGNSNELSILDDFEKNYTSNKALSWYIGNIFVSQLLNKSFQDQTTNLLYLFRFFLHDIQEQLKLNKCQSLVHVYRGQIISNNEFESLKNSTGNFISMNLFLLTNSNRQKVLKYLSDFDELHKVLFEIEADPNLTEIKSFGRTNQDDNDDEILFMIGSIFYINSIHIQQDGITIIRMTLCSDNDQQLQTIFQSLKTINSNDKTNILLFGDVLWKIGKFLEAKNYYQSLLTKLSNDKYYEISECYYALGNLDMEENNYNSSYEWHKKSLEIKKNILKENDPSLADSYSSIADIERKRQNSIQALEYYNKALDILTNTYGNDQPKIAMCLNNIGCIYGEEKNFLKTLEYQEKALKIMEKHFSSDHICLGQAHNNIGSVYRYLGKYNLAIEHYEKSVEIKLKSISSKHPSIASTYNNMANVYEEMNLLQESLNYYEKVASIYRHRFPPTYPENIRITEDIRRITNKLKHS